MTQFSLANLFGITIRESANDGSDFTNPDADYRRLFLGEDGQLHVKDSAGAVTDIGTSGAVASYGCLAARTTNQALSNPLAVAFDATDIYDPDGFHDPGTNPSRITVPTGKGGRLYTIFGNVEVDQAAAWRLKILKNNATIVAFTSFAASSSLLGTICAIDYLADGDYVELLVQNLASGNVIQSDAPTTFGVKS